MGVNSTAEKAKLTNDAESTADGDYWTGVDLTDVLARVALLWVRGSFTAICKIWHFVFVPSFIQGSEKVGLHFDWKWGTPCAKALECPPPWMSAIRRLYVARLSCETLTRSFCVMTAGCTANVPFSECSHATCKKEDRALWVRCILGTYCKAPWMHITGPVDKEGIVVKDGIPVSHI